MEEGFWAEFIIILLVIILLAGGIPSIFRYKMDADKRKWFSYNHINKLHKNIDWTLRITTGFLILTSAIFIHNKPLLISIILAIFIIGQIGIQAFIEWKFSNNRKNFQVSLIQLSLTFISFSGFFLWIF